MASTEEQFETLRGRYRSLRAPAHLESRIQANLPERGSRRLPLIPLGAAVALATVAVLVWVGTPTDSTRVRPSMPSLAQLEQPLPEKPAGLKLSLSGIRMPGQLKTPARPTLPDEDPQAWLGAPSQESHG